MKHLIKPFAITIINLIVFLNIAFILIFLTEFFVVSKYNINIFFSVSWIMTTCLLLINSLKVDWIGWMFPLNKEVKK